MPRPFIIAEAGSTHEGSLDKALQLVQVAHSAGADAVKFQFWSSPQRMRERRGIPVPAYEQGSIQADWLEPLEVEANIRGIWFSASVFLPEDVPALDKHVDYWKVSSFEARDRELTRSIPNDNRVLFVSTGMQETYEDGYLPKRAIRLHCISAYPCPPREANLAGIMRGQGYSDHTRRVETGAFAVCAGADYLEVHYRLDDTAESCPDYPVSLTPDELETYTKLARAAWLMRGDGRKAPQMAERENMKYRVIR